MRLSCAASAFLTNCWVIVEAPCCGRAGDDVVDDRAGDALEVDAAVLVEALVLDRDRRLLHHRRDLVGLVEDPALVVGEGRQLDAVDVVDDRVLRAVVLLAVLERGQVLGDGHHDPEDPGDERERREAEDDDREAQLAHPRLGALLVAIGARGLGQQPASAQASVEAWARRRAGGAGACGALPLGSCSDPDSIE